VRLGLANFRRVRRAMDAVSFRGESDPIRSNWVVRSGLDRKHFFGFYPFKFIIRIIAIVRVGILPI